MLESIILYENLLVSIILLRSDNVDLNYLIALNWGWGTSPNFG